MKRFCLLVILGSFLAASSSTYSSDDSTIWSIIKKQTSESLRNTLEPIAKGLGIDKVTLREVAKQAVIKEYNLHEPSPEWRVLINETIQAFNKNKDFDISDIVFLEGENLGVAAAFAATKLEGLIDIIAALPTEKFYGSHKVVFGLYHEIGHIYHRHDLKSQLIYHASIKIPSLLSAIYLAGLTASLGAALYYNPTLILYTSLAALNILLGIILPNFIATSGITSALNEKFVEKEASLFACEQLIKHGKAHVILKMLASVDDEAEAYLTQCLLEHKDKISAEQLKSQDEVLFKFANNNPVLIKRLLDLGASFSCDNRFSPLSIAIIYQRFDVVEVFVDHKITLETCHEQDPVVLYALAYNKPKVQELAKKYSEFAALPLVQKALELDMYARPNDYSLAKLAQSLLDTTQRNQKELLELVLKYGADPNFQLSDGRVALGEALSRQYINPEIIELLLKHGADPYLVYKNKSALELAQENGNMEIFTLIKRYQTNPISQ